MARLWGQIRLAFSYDLALGLAKIQHAEQKRQRKRERKLGLGYRGMIGADQELSLVFCFSLMKNVGTDLVLILNTKKNQTIVFELFYLGGGFFVCMSGVCQCYMYGQNPAKHISGTCIAPLKTWTYIQCIQVLVDTTLPEAYVNGSVP